MISINQLAAFDPIRLAMCIANLPAGSIVFSLGPEGPKFAMPRPHNELVVGQFYYHEDRIEIWNGAAFSAIARLIEFDGKPSLVYL